jgi:prefoldin subunit 5
MNPFNLIINYFIANSRAEFYKKDPQEIQKIGLIAGMISTNPIISYLLIENKAKELEVIPARNSAPTGTATGGSTTPTIPTSTGTLTTTPPGSILKKLDELDKKLGENHKAIGDLTKKVETIEKSLQENKAGIDSINTTITELPKVIDRLGALERKVEAISNVQPATVTEVKPLTKK